MAGNTIGILERRLARDGSLTEREALLVLRDKSLPLSRLLALTDRLRFGHSGKKIRLCAIVNARSGNCGEDCAFCAQSAHWSTEVKKYSLLSAEKLSDSAQAALAAGAGEFSIVTSGATIRAEKEVKILEEALERIRNISGHLQRCASLGRISPRILQRLKNAGLDCLHHNLETNSSFFPQICTTHNHAERVATVRRAKACGLRVCSGGIFGMGEEDADRVALAFELKELDLDSVPLNFLHPIPGTPLEKAPILEPEAALRIIAMFRLVLPEKDIIVCGGREVTLRDLQSMIFWAGANGILIGNYLTTSGRKAAEDLKMLEDLGLEPYVAQRDRSSTPG
ncbi:MAG TPA: biotin synthase BioB [archaeon]|nr:biotin synthase BioB [archaeon]